MGLPILSERERADAHDVADATFEVLAFWLRDMLRAQMRLACRIGLWLNRRGA